MASATTNMRFRNIDEGEGATFPIQDEDDIAPRIGTYFLMTCVGVYFKVDEGRCFFAHMDGRTPETWPFNFITKEGGEEIVRQVKRKLRGFLQVDHWDIKNEEFGKDLRLQCPCAGDKPVVSQTFQRAGRYVVRGIREFFGACSQTLNDEVEEMRGASLPGGTLVRDYEQKADRLNRKATELYRTGKDTAVDCDHHILIVEPDSGRTWRLGLARPGGAKKQHLGDHIPDTRYQLP